MGVWWTMLMVLGILLFLVLPSLKTRTFHVKKLLLMPALFIYLLYDSLTSTFHFHNDDIFTIVFAALLGIILGILLRRGTKIEVDHEYHLITLPGSYISLIFFSLIFAAHFVVGYFKSVSPSVFLETNILETILLFFLVSTSCMTVGGSGCLLWQYLSHSER